MTPEERPRRALAFSLLASLCFSGMSMSVKGLHGGVATPECVFYRGAVGGTVLLLVHLVTGAPLRVGAPGVMVLRIITGTLSLLSYYGAIGGIGHEEGALATANLLLKTAPVWVALGAGFLLGEKAGARTWLALAVGLVGATIALLGPVGPGGGRLTIALGLASGFFAAGAYLAVRRLATSEDPLAVVTLFLLGVAAVMLPVVIWRWKPLPREPQILLLGGVGGFGAIAQLFMTHAYRHSKAAIVAVAGLAEVAFTVLAAIVLFGERPTVATFAGGAIAVASGFVATWPKKKPPTPSPSP